MPQAFLKISSVLSHLEIIQEKADPILVLSRMPPNSSEYSTPFAQVLFWYILVFGNIVRR
jgi:hypothetical protein